MLARPPLAAPRKGLCKGRALQSKWMYGPAENDTANDKENAREKEKGRNAAAGKQLAKALAQGAARPLAERTPNQGAASAQPLAKLQPAKPLSFTAPRMRPGSADVGSRGRRMQGGNLDGGAERPGSARVPRLEFGREDMAILGDVVVRSARDQSPSGRACGPSSEERAKQDENEENSAPQLCAERNRDRPWAQAHRVCPIERPSERGRYSATPASVVAPATGLPCVRAKAYAVVDGDTGEMLVGGSHNFRRPIASLTKVMTCMIVVDLAARDERILEEQLLVSEAASRIIGTSARLRSGDCLSVRHALLAMMLPSGNDAAWALAEHFGMRLYARRVAASRRARKVREERGREALEDNVINSALPSGNEALEILGGKQRDATHDPVSNWVAEMNFYAAHLQLLSTHFENPHGMSQRWHLSTARDAAALTVAALQRPLFLRVVGTAEATIPVRNEMNKEQPEREMTYQNTNALLAEGHFGVKTGTTPAAGHCLASAKRVPLGGGQSRCLVTIVLACSSKEERYEDTRLLMAWAAARPRRAGWRPRTARA